MTELKAGGPDQVLRLFDAKAATWSAKYAPEGRLVWRLSLFARAVDRHVAPDGHVLDLGCGTGELARHLANGGRRVTGCDISDAMLVRAAGADPEGVVEWVKLAADWTVLPFADGTFDAVVASSVLEYVDDPLAVLHECRRVTAAGGTVLCTVPDMRHPIRWLELLSAGLARLPLCRLAIQRSPRLTAYVSYLRISRRRHSLRWWCSVPATCGLQATRAPVRAGSRRRFDCSALRSANSEEMT